MKDSIKVVLVGSCGCGKTSIITRLVSNTFSEEYISTEGGAYNQIDFTYPQFDNKTLNMEVWDTAGQEKYRSLTKIFYKDADIAILVYDITNKASFLELKEYWMEQVQEHGISDISKNIFIFLIHFLVIGMAGNKSDLFNKEEVDENEAKSYAESNGAVFKVTSAFNNSGIRDLFFELGKKYMEKYCVEETGNKTGGNKKKKDQDKLQLNKKEHDKKKKKFC